MSQFQGLGGLVLIIFLIFTLCTVFCYIRAWRRRNAQQNTPRRSHSMVYSVTMQGGSGSTFYNSVNEYLRNSQTGQEEFDQSTRQRHINDNLENAKVLSPKGLPSYDDVISGKFDGNYEPPPPYSEASTSDMGTPSSDR